MGRFSELDMYYFGQATHYDIYRKLGAHPVVEKGKKGICFTLWAPNAQKVSVIGSFNNWQEDANEMERLEPMGIYEAFIPEASVGDMYKFYIETRDGRKLYKADPYANYAELRPGTASVVTDIEHFKWTDNKWMEKRKAVKDVHSQPMAIYEVHPGSWMRHPGREDEGFYSYRELAERLTAYVKEMGYNAECNISNTFILGKFDYFLNSIPITNQVSIFQKQLFTTFLRKKINDLLRLIL